MMECLEQAEQQSNVLSHQYGLELWGTLRYKIQQIPTLFTYFVPE